MNYEAVFEQIVNNLSSAFLSRGGPSLAPRPGCLIVALVCVKESGDATLLSMSLCSWDPQRREHEMLCGLTLPSQSIRSNSKTLFRLPGSQSTSFRSNGMFLIWKSAYHETQHLDFSMPQTSACHEIIMPLSSACHEPCHIIKHRVPLNSAYNDPSMPWDSSCYMQFSMSGKSSYYKTMHATDPSMPWDSAWHDTEHSIALYRVFN
jgi:hypothetical protein